MSGGERREYFELVQQEANFRGVFNIHNLGNNPLAHGMTRNRAGQNTPSRFPFGSAAAQYDPSRGLLPEKTGHVLGGTADERWPQQ